MDPSYLKKLEQVQSRFRELDRQLSDSKVASNPTASTKLSKERSLLAETVDTYERYQTVLSEISSNKELLLDAEMKEMAQEEVIQLEAKKRDLEGKLKILLIPKDPNDEKNILLEIRAGTGGDEASLFAGDLYRMYSKYAETQRWKVEVLNASWTGVKGLKEIIVMISGDRVYSQLKYESGVHRVQRVPKTESMGRVHTSAVTVAVLAEADEVEVNINPSELKIDVFRSSGPGGQSVNTTDSAVRITHVPTGTVVSCQDEKSQHKNKARAMKILRSRIYDVQLQKQNQERSQHRRSQIGSGDRSEKIRTYNFPQSRITDHRVGLTMHNLDEVLAGHLEHLVPKLQNFFQDMAVKESEES